jgi:hypothetical protein
MGKNGVAGLVLAGATGLVADGLPGYKSATSVMNN